MSHFTVLVIGDNPEEQLAPYQENNMGDCPKEYLEFKDLESEYLEEYEDGTEERFVDSQGNHYSRYDDIFYREPTEKEYREICIGGTGHTGGKDGFSFTSKEWKDGKGYRPKVHFIPEGFRKEDIPNRQIYSSFEKYVEEWHGETEKDPATNRYGYWENPNAKWDGYQIGGRWTGFFKLKNQIGDQKPPHKKGNPGLMTEEAQEGYADQCRKGDIDWEGIKEEGRKKANKRYDMYEKYFKSLESTFIPWSTFIKRVKNNEIDIEEARQLYHSQPIMEHKKEVASQLHREHEDHNFVVWVDLDEFIGKSRETYAEEMASNKIQTFAIVKDGKWYEKGEMGWWAIVTNKKDEEEWDRQYAQLLGDLSDDTLLTLVDCHI